MPSESTHADLEALGIHGELPRSGNRVPPRFEVASESSRGRVPGAASVDAAPSTAASETFAFEYAGAVSIPFPLVLRTGT